MGGVNESTANFGKSLADTKGKWVRMGGTFASPLDSACTKACFATLFSRFVGSGTVTWWIADISILRLNGALMNVIRTNATDVNVSSGSSGKQYTRGLDFELLPPKTAPQHYDPPFLTMFKARDEATSIRRLPGGAISPQEQVLVSYDFGTNIVVRLPTSRIHCSIVLILMRVVASPAVFSSAVAGRSKAQRPSCNGRPSAFC